MSRRGLAGRGLAGQVMARRGRASSAWAAPGAVWHGMEPVTAVGREHVSRPSAAPGQRWVRSGPARQGTVRLGDARPGEDRADGRSAGSTPAPPALAVRLGKARLGQARHGQAWSGWVAHGVDGWMVSGAVRLRATHSTGLGEAGRGRVWSGRVGCGMTWASPGSAWQGAGDQQPSGCEARTPATSDMTRQGAVSRALARRAWVRRGQVWATGRHRSSSLRRPLHMARLGMAGSGPVRSGGSWLSTAWLGTTGDRQPPGFEALAPTAHGQARLAQVGPGWTGLGLGQAGRGMDYIELPNGDTCD